jgi:hypothetical protein
MPTYSIFNITTGNPDGTISFTPSGSAYAPTSSNAATAAQVDIIVSSHTLTNIISNAPNANFNPYLQIPLISGSNFLEGINQDLIIRFYSASHLNENYLHVFNSTSDTLITGYLSESCDTLYYSSLPLGSEFRDISYVTNDSGSLLRDKIFDIITGSAAHRLHSSISASKNESSAGGINYYSCSIHYINIRGQINPPSIYTGSFSELSGSLMISAPNTGSGLLNFVENLTMPSVSSSFNIGFDPLDGKSMLFSVSTSSLSYEGTGRSSSNLLYFSSSGKIGINTSDPQSGFDVVSDEVQFQKPGSRKGLKINNEGNIESFNKDIASATTGSEFILKYSRGTTITQASLDTLGIIVANDAAATSYFNALRSEEQNIILEKLEFLGFINSPEVGDTLGSIRFIAESGSLAGFNSRVAGEAALIKAVVNSIDATGVQADLIFSVASKGSSSQQKLLLDAGNNHELTGSLNISQGVIATSFTGLNISASGYLVAQNITSSANISASGIITAFSSNIVTINGGSF